MKINETGPAFCTCIERSPAKTTTIFFAAQIVLQCVVIGPARLGDSFKALKELQMLQVLEPAALPSSI